MEHLRQHPEDRPFSHLICDEVQDFNTPELRAMRAMTEEGDNDMFLVGDPMQNIYGKQLSFQEAGIHIKGKRSHVLQVNYRTTEQIRQCSLRALQGMAFPDFEQQPLQRQRSQSLLQGSEPAYYCLESREAEVSKVQELLQQLLQEDIAPQEICIAARKHSGLEDLQTLHEEVQYSTFHNLKGMEFKAMILTGLQQEDIPFIPRDFSDYSPEEQALHLRQEASVLYVAMSRAVRVLLLTGSGQRLEWWGEG